MNHRKRPLLFWTSVIVAVVTVLMAAPVTSADMNMTRRGLITITISEDAWPEPVEQPEETEVPANTTDQGQDATQPVHEQPETSVPTPEEEPSETPHESEPSPLNEVSADTIIDESSSPTEGTDAHE